MAVLNIVDGLTAEILINGEPATEYPDPDEIQVSHENNAIRAYQIKHTVSKYIESQSGQNFSIRMRVGRPLGHANMAHAKLTMDCEVDGILVWSLICARPWFKKHPDGAEWVDVLAGPKNGKGRACTVREFSFLKIQTSSDFTESKTIKRQKARMEGKGTIVIKVYNASAGRSGGPTIVVPKDGFLKRDEANVSEMAVKGTAKSHAAMFVNPLRTLAEILNVRLPSSSSLTNLGISLGKAKKTARGPVFRTEKKDGEDYPLAVFRFIYRDLDSLKQMHVIPRDPSPTPPPSSRGPSPTPSSSREGSASREMPEPTYEQLREMINKHRRENGGGSFKRSTTNRGKSTKVKKERGEKRGLSDAEERKGKKLKVDKNGVVDLTSYNEDKEREEEAAAGGDGDSERGRAIGEASEHGEGLFVLQRQR
ncbi:hypothetical protein ACEPPN_017559 [Leptodophora sp. 'Broadleaf-Isolate-01']